MVDLSSIGSNSTPLGAQDRLLPESIIQGKGLVKLISGGKNPSDSEAASLSLAITTIINSTKGTEVDKLWGRIENALNQNKPLKIPNDASEDQVQATLGLMYNLLNVIDKGSNTNLMSQFRSLYLETQKHVEDRFLSQFEDTAQNKIKRVIRITNRRVSSIIKRMNLDVAKGNIAGPEIPT